MSDKQSQAKEVRSIVLERIELRAAKEGIDSPGTVVGYASVFGPLSEDLGGFVEKVEKGAFQRALSANQDIAALFNHDENFPIGRRSAGTLRLEEDDEGLRSEIDLPNNTFGRDLAVSIARGDVRGMSFSFRVGPGGDSWDFSKPVPLRTLRDIDQVLDVGPVVFPAYRDTSVAMRSLSEARERASAPPPPDPAELEAKRAEELQAHQDRLRAMELGKGL